MLTISISLSVMLSYGSISDDFYAYGSISIPQSSSGPFLNDSGLKVEAVFRGINFPTSMAFLDNNDILVLEKNEGTVRRIANGNMLEDPLLKVNVSSKGERGMLGIAVAKDNSTISKPPFIFLYYTEAAETVPNKEVVKEKVGEMPAMNRLYRYELVDNKLVNPKLVLDLPPTTRFVHNGGTVSIGTDGNVYLTVGDMLGKNPQISDLPSGDAGILRVNQEGEPVKTGENEYVLGSAHPLNKYYAYGIRNSFGMDFDPITGNLWDTENGPEFGDEINLVGPGFNSGWKEIQGSWDGRNLNITNAYPEDLLDIQGKSYYSSPELASIPSMGLTGLSFFDSDKYGPHYENDLFVGDFHNGFLYHFELSRDRTELNLTLGLRDKIADNMNELNQNILGLGFGGITDIDVGPDGYLYVLTLYKGGDNCPSILPEEEIDALIDKKECINYDSELQGTIFRVVPRIE